MLDTAGQNLFRIEFYFNAEHWREIAEMRISSQFVGTFFNVSSQQKRQRHQNRFDYQ